MPLGVETFEFVAHMRRVRRAVAYRRYAYGERVFVGSEVDPVEVSNAFRGLQRIAPRADGLVVGHEVGQYDGKSSVVGFQLCGVERDEPVGTSGVDASVFCFAERRIVELIVQQSVVGGENVIAQGFGIETYEAFVRRDPENTLRILFDPIAGVERQPALVPDERVGFGIIPAQAPALGREPYSVVPVFEDAQDLVCRKRGRIPFCVKIMAPCVFHGVVFVKSVGIGGRPDISGGIFPDVIYMAPNRRIADEPVCRTVVAFESGCGSDP